MKVFGMLIVILATWTTGTANGQAKIDIENVVSHFENKCFRLEQASPSEIKALIKMNEIGYFSSFCDTVGFQSCNDFNEALYPLGSLAERPNGSCQISPIPNANTFAGN